MPIPFATAEVVTAVEMNELARTHWRKVTTKQVVNSVTETDLLNGEITIDAGAMSTNRTLRLTAWGDGTNNSGSTQAGPRFRVKLGAVAYLDTGAVAAAWGTNAARVPWRAICEITNLGAANSQWVGFEITISCPNLAAAGAAFTSGEGNYASVNASGGSGILRAQGVGSGAVDTTTAQALALTVILPVANASLDMTLKAATVELV